VTRAALRSRRYCRPDLEQSREGGFPTRLAYLPELNTLHLKDHLYVHGPTTSAHIGVRVDIRVNCSVCFHLSRIIFTANSQSSPYRHPPFVRFLDMATSNGDIRHRHANGTTIAGKNDFRVTSDEDAKSSSNSFNLLICVGGIYASLYDPIRHRANGRLLIP